MKQEAMINNVKAQLRVQTMMHYCSCPWKQQGTQQNQKLGWQSRSCFLNWGAQPPWGPQSGSLGATSRGLY